MARLEAQRAICDAAEKELHKKYRHRNDIEKQIRPEWEQGRKRFRIDDCISEEERGNKPVLYLPGTRPRTPLHKELRVLMEEEQRAASEAGLSANEEEKQEEKEEEEDLKISANCVTEERLEEHSRSLVVLDEAETEEKGEYSIEHRLQKLEISEEKRSCGYSFRSLHETKTEEDEETRKQRGKGNVDKWLQMLLDNDQGEGTDAQETKENASGRTDTEDIIQQLNQKFPLKELKDSEVSDSDYTQKQPQLLQDKNSTEKYSTEACIDEANGTTSFEGIEKSKEQHKKEKRLFRSESAKVLRRIPSSPSLFFKTIKKAVKL